MERSREIYNIRFRDPGWLEARASLNLVRATLNFSSGESSEHSRLVGERADLREL
jgi:hypothetical protein